MNEAELIGAAVGAAIVAVSVRLWEGKWDALSVGFALGTAWIAVVGVLV